MAKYILSIDGGGLRGLIPALVLAELSRRLEAKAGRPVELSRVFDLMAGAGSGGLIAAGLASPRSSARTPRRSAPMRSSSCSAATCARRASAASSPAGPTTAAGWRTCSTGSCPPRASARPESPSCSPPAIRRPARQCA